MKISNKRILQIFSHCINENRTKLTKSNYKEEIVDKLNSIPNLEIKFECSCGVSKLVLRPLDNENNFVIKIPFTGYESGDKYYPFNYEDSGITWYPGNYCDIEAERCKEIIKAGWGDYIAKTALIGIVGDLFIYKQELVDTIAEDKFYEDKDIEDKLDSVRNSNYMTEDLDEYWVMDMIDYAGENETSAFIGYLVYNGFDSDIHGANCGFKNGVPKIFDYSSFED